MGLWGSGLGSWGSGSGGSGPRGCGLGLGRLELRGAELWGSGFKRLGSEII